MDKLFDEGVCKCSVGGHETKNLHIYRSCIHFSIGTDGQCRFTDGELVYHLYRPYRWTRFLGATLCPCNNANYIIHERILHIYRSCIHFSIGTDGQHLLPMENWLTIGTDRTDGQGFGGLPYALAIMLTTSFTKGFCTFTDRVFISPSVSTDNFGLPMDNWFTIGTDRTNGQGFWGLPYALAIMLTTSFTKGFCTFTDRVFISPSVPTDNFDLPMHNWFTIGTDRTDGQGFWGLPYALAVMLTTSFTKGFCTFTDRVFISPSVPTDNFDLPMDNWFTIGTDRTDGQGFWGLPYALAIMLTTSFTKGFCTFTDLVFISPSVPTDNFDLPMENWFTICTDRTNGQGFWGLAYALAIMLTTSFTKGFCTFTDRVFISPSVPMDNFDLPMDNWFTICTDRTDGQGFWGATLCPCNNANYLIHDRIVYIYRSCIHFPIRTDGELRFTDGQLVYHLYRPYRWTRFLGGYLVPLQ